MKLLIRSLFNKSKEYLLLIFLLLISLSLLPLNKNSDVKKIKGYAFGALVVAGNIADGISSILTDNSETEKLRKENAELMLQINLLREYALENNELKELLDFRLNSFSKLIPSTVVAKNISNVQGVFILNSGIEDSIQIGMPVVSEKGLVGIVVEVSNNFSVVQTLENSSLRVSATIQRNNINGILSWNGNRLIMQNIPTTADINKGDRVVTSVLSTLFPQSIPIGLVVKKESNISGLLSDITIKPFVNIPTIKNVFVVAEIKSTQIDSLELNLLRN